jgi:hypothetical protein
MIRRGIDRDDDDREDVVYLDYDAEERPREGRNASDSVDNVDSDTRRRLSIGNKPKFSLKQGGGVTSASLNTELAEESKDLNVKSTSVSNDISYDDRPDIDFSTSIYTSEVTWTL